MTNQYPRISVIMPAYNAEKYIEESVGSVLSQNYPNFELIIVNDGSTDRTLEVLAQFTDPRIRVFSQENKGQSIAMNFGIRQSSGEFIKFLDADDLINSDHLLSQYNAIKDAPNCIASCRWAYFTGSYEHVNFLKEKTHKNYVNPVDWIYDSLTYDKGMMGGWMWLIPRQVLEKAGYWDERLSLNNDFDFSIRVLLSSSGIHFASGAKFYYRKGVSNALSGTFSEKAFESAYLTTCLGRDHLLKREDTPRVRKLLADRFQGWVYIMYSSYAEMAEKAQAAADALGGSALKPSGGLLFRTLNTFLPWKTIRIMQSVIYKASIWQIVLKCKEKQRLEKISISRRGDDY